MAVFGTETHPFDYLRRPPTPFGIPVTRASSRPDTVPGLDRSSLAATAAILVLSVAATLLGLLRSGHYGVEGELLLRLRAQDAAILFVAVPALAVGTRYARRGSLRGRILWLGGLAYTTYVWASVAGTTPFNAFFPGYVALVALSLWTLVGGVARTNPEPVRRRLDGRISRPLYAGFLGVTAVGLAAMWLADLVPAILAGTEPLVLEELGEAAIHTYVLDLAVVVPALGIAAVWLHRGRAWGYVFAGVLLTMAALLAPTLTAITVLDALGDHVTLTAPLVVGTVLPPVVAAAFAVRYLLALGGGARSPERDRSDAQGSEL